MPITRRNTLIGLGTLAAGGGVVIGTGAFDTVEAQRQLTVETDEDTSALLGIEAAEGYEPFVEQTEDGIVLDIGDLGEEGGSGLNRNARTTFSDLLTFTNNGTETVESITFDIVEQELDGDDSVEILTIPEDANIESADLGPGQSIDGFGLTIDLIGQEGFHDSSFDATISIEASSESS